MAHFTSLFLFKVLLAAFISYDGGYIYNKWTWIMGALFAVGVSYCLFHVAEDPSIKHLKLLRKAAAQDEKLRKPLRVETHEGVG